MRQPLESARDERTSLEAFASLKQSLWEWNAIASDIPETDLIKGARDYLDEIRSFEARGYEVKAGTSARNRRDGSVVPMAILVAFKKPKGTGGTPDEVWLPKKLSVGFWD